MTKRLDMMAFLYRRGERTMRFRRLTSALLFVLPGSLFVTAFVASAWPKEDVAAATMKWAQTLGQNDPDKIVQRLWQHRCQHLLLHVIVYQGQRNQDAASTL